MVGQYACDRSERDITYAHSVEDPRAATYRARSVGDEVRIGSGLVTTRNLWHADQPDIIRHESIQRKNQLKCAVRSRLWLPPTPTLIPISCLSPRAGEFPSDTISFRRYRVPRVLGTTRRVFEHPRSSFQRYEGRPKPRDSPATTARATLPTLTLRENPRAHLAFEISVESSSARLYHVRLPALHGTEKPFDAGQDVSWKTHGSFVVSAVLNSSIRESFLRCHDGVFFCFFFRVEQRVGHYSLRPSYHRQRH